MRASPIVGIGLCPRGRKPPSAECRYRRSSGAGVPRNANRCRTKLPISPGASGYSRRSAGPGFLRGSGPWAVSSAPRFGNFYIEFLLEELQPRHSNLECLPGKLSLVEEIQLVLADLRRTQLVRRLVEILEGIVGHDVARILQSGTMPASAKALGASGFAINHFQILPLRRFSALRSVIPTSMPITSSAFQPVFGLKASTNP